jgi:hypothetical protein
MSKTRRWARAVVAAPGFSLVDGAGASPDEFIGPFPSWANVKTDYGAVGDGKADDTAAIQKALDDLRSEKRTRNVLYFPAGAYRLNRTLVIPAEADLQLLGDGPENATQLFNAGGANPLIRVLGPSYATLRSLFVKAGNDAVGIQVENCDQPGARVNAEQLNVGGFEYGFVAVNDRKETAKCK